MKPSIARKLDQLTGRLDELNALLGSEDVTANMANFRKLSREHAEIEPVVALYRTYLQSERDAQTAQEMAQDPEMREFAEFPRPPGIPTLQRRLTHPASSPPFRI